MSRSGVIEVVVIQRVCRCAIHQRRVMQSEAFAASDERSRTACAAIQCIGDQSVYHRLLRAGKCDGKVVEQALANQFNDVSRQRCGREVAGAVDDLPR